MTVYLLHGDHPDGRVIHYVGYTSRTGEERLRGHLKGISKFTSNMQKLGFSWKLVREWEGRDRKFERHIKALRSNKYLCSCCGVPVNNIESRTGREIRELWYVKNQGGADGARDPEGADHAGEEFVH